MAEQKEKEDELAKYKALEREGLERSYPDKGFANDNSWYFRLGDASGEMSNYFAKNDEPKWADYTEVLQGIVNNIGPKQKGKCEEEVDTKHECSVSDLTQQELKRMNAQSVITRGNICTNVFEQVKTGERYKYDEFVNDLTSCWHRAIEKYEVAAKEWHKEGKCSWRT